MSSLKQVICTLPANIDVHDISGTVVNLRMLIGSDIHAEAMRTSQWFFNQKYFSIANLDLLNGMEITFRKTVQP